MKEKGQGHLINILKNTKDHHPNFTVFLGAGASVTSGIGSAKTMIDEWRTQYEDIYGKSAIQKQRWYETDDEYSELFEVLYDQSSQRREFIETCIEGKNPSWGYIYLVNLIENNVFNTVFTTNFDDLLNEACYLYSSAQRPIVCAHDSSIKSVRISSKRPKIVKLHGDYLFDDIKNTGRELRNLGQNMEDKFRQYAPEFGLIFVGYSGNDESVMSCLEALLAEENSYPHGVYWCCRSKGELNAKVENLQRYEKFKVIEITGFDEFFAELHSSLDLSLQKELSDPYETLKSRLNSFVDRSNIPVHQAHPVISQDVQALSKKLQDLSVDLEADEADLFKVSNNSRSNLVPHLLVAHAAFRENKLKEAANAIKLYFKTSVSANAIRLGYDVLFQEYDGDLEKILTSKYQENIAQLLKENSYLPSSIVYEGLKVGKYDYVKKLSIATLAVLQQQKLLIRPYDDFAGFIINYAQSYRHLSEDIPESVIHMLKEIRDTSGSKLNKIGSLVVLDQISDALNLLKTLSPEAILTFMTWPISELILEDQLVDFVVSHLVLNNYRNEAHHAVVELINLKRFLLADKILEIAKHSDKGNFNEDFYWLNKGQIYLHQDKAVPEGILTHVKLILDQASDIRTKIASYIIMGDVNRAKNLLENLDDDHFKSLPIVKLIVSNEN